MSDLLAVFDANVFIKACIAIERGVAAPEPWWNVETSRAAEASAALFKAVSSPLNAQLVVVTDEWLDDIILRKLTQPTGADRPEDRGLGWAHEMALDRYESLLEQIDHAGRSYRIDPPPPAQPLGGVDYEDCRIWGLFQAAIGRRPTAEPFLVTLDADFARQALDRYIARQLDAENNPAA